MKSILGLCIIVFLASPVFAQTVDLGKIMVVTPKRTGEPAQEVSSNVTVITRDQIESSGAQNVPDVLRTALGIHVYDFSTTKTATIDIRGFGDAAKQNVLVLVDGRRTNSIDISGADWIQIPVELIERIEVVRGGGSVLYGDNAVGGVVNIITRQSDNELDVETVSTAGSYDTYGQDVLLSGTHADTRYQAYYKYYEDGGWRQNSDGVARDGNVKLGHDFTDRLSVDVRAGAHDDLQHYPGSLRLIDLPSKSRKGTRFPHDFAHTKEWYAESVLKWLAWEEEDDRGVFELTLNRRDREAFSSYFDGSTVSNSEIQTDGVLLKYISESTLNDRALTGVFGVDYYDHENDILGSGLFNSEDLTISKTEAGIYGTLEYEVTDNLSAHAGTRYHQAEYTFTQRDITVNSSQRPDEWVSQGGIEYEYAENSSVHADVRQTFRFLATDEWYSAGTAPPDFIAPGLNPGLKQQTGTEYEWGVKHDFGQGVEVSATNYLHDIENEIYFDPTTFANSNYDKTRRIGVELAPSWDVLDVFHWQAFDRFDLKGAYTWQQAEFRGGIYDGKEIPFVPEHQISATVDARVWGHYGFSLTGRYVGSSYPVNDQANAKPRIKPYAVFDAQLSYEKLGENLDWEIFGRIENIFDQEYNSYEIEGSNRAIYPSAGREVLVGAKLKF